MKNNNISVWIVIPTWNRCNDLVACLKSLSLVTFQPIKVLVVDNNSDDRTIEEITQQFPEVEIISLPKNLGAPKASNIGFEYALHQGAKYILRMDSDTIVSPNFLEPLINKLDENPKIGVVSPKIFFYDPPHLIWYAGVDAHPWHLGSINNQINKRDNEITNQSRAVDYVWGAAMLIKREVLEKTKGFDPDFFIYYEEIDFCLRVQSLDYKLWFVPASHIWHKVGSSVNNEWTAFQWNRSKTLLYRKHAKHIFHLLYLITYAVIYAIISPIFLGKSGNRGPLLNTFAGLLSGLRFKIN